MMRECHMREAPSYFEFFATKSSEYFYKKYAAKWGGIPASMDISPDIRTLNDGNEYFLGYKTNWNDPVRKIMMSPTHG